MIIEKPMPRDQVHHLLHNMFSAVTNPTTKPEQFADMLTPDYVQRVDGKELDYAGFLSHWEALQASISSSRVSFEHIVTDGISAATVHIAEAIKLDGQPIRLNGNRFLSVPR